MSENVVKREHSLPAIKELYKDVDMVIETSKLNLLLNQPPAPSWVKQHPTIKMDVIINGKKERVPHVYLPIQRVEWLLTRVFLKWWFEVKEIKLIANSICVRGTLHYFNHYAGEKGEWEMQDGVGANPLQTDKNSGAIDFNNMKTNAVQIGLPAAESYAIKDAAEKIGRLFGKDLGRADEISYSNLITSIDNLEIKKDISKLIEGLKDGEFKEEIINELTEAERMGANTLEFYDRIKTKINEHSNTKK